MIRHNFTLWRVCLFGVLVILTIIALTSLTSDTNKKPILLSADRAVERIILSSDGTIPNSKFVVTRSSKSYDVNTAPSCHVRHCNQTNNFLAFCACKPDIKSGSISKATELNALGVNTMARFVQGSSSLVEGFGFLDLTRALHYFGNATAESNEECWAPLINYGLLLMKFKQYDLAFRQFRAAIANSPTREKEAIANLFAGFTLEFSSGSNHIVHYDRVRELDPQVEVDYWGIPLTKNGRKQLSENHKNYMLPALLDMLLYKHFAPVSIGQYALLSPGTQDFFIENRYIVLRHILPPFVLSAMQKTYHDLIKSGTLRFGDGQAERYVTYNDRVNRFVHVQITDLVRSVIAHNALPSYTYFGGYKGGSKLAPHTDRQACEFTLSLTIQQHPHDKPWLLSAGKNPLFENDPKFNGRGGASIPPEDQIVDAELFAGDGLLFMGRHLVHFRRGELPQGHWINQVFFHYVQEGFTGELA